MDSVCDFNIKIHDQIMNSNKGTRGSNRSKNSILSRNLKVEIDSKGSFMIINKSNGKVTFGKDSHNKENGSDNINKNSKDYS